MNLKFLTIKQQLFLFSQKVIELSEISTIKVIIYHSKRPTESGKKLKLKFDISNRLCKFK